MLLYLFIILFIFIIKAPQTYSLPNNESLCAKKNRWLNHCDNNSCKWIYCDNNSKAIMKFDKLISAHQGWGEEEGETIEKIANTKANGLYGVELDIRFDNNGTPVLSHDLDLTHEYNGYTTFEEALDYVSKNSMTMMVEIKDGVTGNEAILEEIVDLAEKYDMTSSILWWSFRPYVLKTLAEIFNDKNISMARFRMIEANCIYGNSNDEYRLNHYYCKDADTILTSNGYNKQQIANDVYTSIKGYTDRDYLVYIPEYLNGQTTNQSDKIITNTEIRNFPQYSIISYYEKGHILGQSTCNSECSLLSYDSFTDKLFENSDNCFSGWAESQDATKIDYSDKSNLSTKKDSYNLHAICLNDVNVYEKEVSVPDTFEGANELNYIISSILLLIGMGTYIFILVRD